MLPRCARGRHLTTPPCVGSFDCSPVWGAVLLVVAAVGVGRRWPSGEGPRPWVFVASVSRRSSRRNVTRWRMRIAGDTFSRGRTFLPGLATGSLLPAAPAFAPATDSGWLTSAGRLAGASQQTSRWLMHPFGVVPWVWRSGILCTSRAGAVCRCQAGGVAIWQTAARARHQPPLPQSRPRISIASPLQPPYRLRLSPQRGAR